MARQGKILPGVRVSKADLAHIFGTELSIIDIWLCRGLPYIQRPKPKEGEPPNERDWIFDTAEAIEWRISTARVEDHW